DFLRLLLSRNAGETWETVPIDQEALDRFGGRVFAQAAYNLAIGVQPDRLERVYLGLIRTIGTGNGLSGGDNVRWGNLGFPVIGARVHTHVDQHAWLINPGEASAYNGNDGGIWRVIPEFGR